MGIENQDGIVPNDFGFALEKIINESRQNPAESPFLFLARHFGSEGRRKLQRFETELGIGFSPQEPLAPTSGLFKEIDPELREMFFQGYGAAGLDALVETILDARNTFSFDFNYMGAIFDERTIGTSVDRIIKERMPSVPLDVSRLLRLFDQDESGGFILSEGGLELVPGLKRLLVRTDLLMLIRTRNMTSWSAFTESLKTELGHKSLSILRTAEAAQDMPILKGKDPFETDRWNDLYEKPSNAPKNR